MTGRARSDEGFGLVELLIALTVLNIAVLALFATYNAGALSIRRASQSATSTTLAEKQLELYRAMAYSSVSLNPALVAAATDSTHTGDGAWAATQVTSAACAEASAACMPVQTVTGPDSRSYRLDSYVTLLQPGVDVPATARALKQVTVVVRQADPLKAKPLARLVTTFDQATSCNGTTIPC